MTKVELPYYYDVFTRLLLDLITLYLISTQYPDTENIFGTVKIMSNVRQSCVHPSLYRITNLIHDTIIFTEIEIEPVTIKTCSMKEL